MWFAMLLLVVVLLLVADLLLVASCVLVLSFLCLHFLSEAAQRRLMRRACSGAVIKGNINYCPSDWMRPYVNVAQGPNYEGITPTKLPSEPPAGCRGLMLEEYLPFL